MSYSITGTLHSALDGPYGISRSLMSGVVQSEAAIFKLEPETKAWLAQLQVSFPTTPAPSRWYIKALDKLIKKLKGDNVLQQMDRFWIFATEQQNHSLVSIVNPNINISGTTWPVNITAVNNPKWAALTGYTGNSSGYLNTNYSVGASGQNNINYQVNNASFGGYYTGSVLLSTGPAFMGSWNGGGAPTPAAVLWPYYQPSGNVSVSVINNNCCSGIAYVDTTIIYTNQGMFTCGTTALGTAYITNRDTQLNGNVNTANKAYPTGNYPFFIMATNEGGSPGYTDPGRSFSMAFIGAGTINQPAFYQDFQDFAETIGFAR